ncbi:MAG: hypothetical protein ASUL_09669 [Candidatus Aramenus sulfurataquae]|uniref:VapB-type antitoxin n=1 Tax=Candidatus Aramenus sulfurataquae TaxID=1326980 RepID=W7KGV1_9CREN|nr:MAG: hypothetical protein ASUL_09669 [Candidatus Aramenus sulfurataquae]
MKKLETVKIKAETKRKLRKLIWELEAKYERKFSFDDAINYLLEERERKKPELLEKVFGAVSGASLHEELRAERQKDEERAKRKFSA